MFHATTIVAVRRAGKVVLAGDGQVSMSNTVVNSWNEWDPLKHVIVGRADNCHIPPPEPALDAALWICGQRGAQPSFNTPLSRLTASGCPKT